MLCDHCLINEANIQMRLTRNNETTDLNLCPACAAKMQPGSGAFPPLFDSFFSHGWSGPNLIGTALFGSEAGRQAEPVRHCSHCGQSYQDFRTTGLLGCGHCYETFRPWLEQVLKRVQRDTRHVGHLPGQADQSPAVTKAPPGRSARCAGTPSAAEPESADRLSILRSQLAEAIQDEDYTLAADLRDQIKATENKAKDAESPPVPGQDGQEPAAEQPQAD
ncbi:MAG: hypothetical protein GX832_01430 [Clostridiales bacterium]|nr:hypothetical protein [Clostridiales bacterium]